MNFRSKMLTVKIMIFTVFVLFFSFTTPIYAQTKMPAEHLQLHYSFDKTSENGSIEDQSGNNYTALLKNGASIKKAGKHQVLDMGSNNGFLNMGAKTGELIASLNNFTISALVYIGEDTDLSRNGNFIFTFANSDNLASNPDGGMFFSAISTRFATSQTDWRREQSISYGRPLSKGEWQHLVYTQQGNKGSIFINGAKVKEDNISMSPAQLGNTNFNYLGKSCYAGDVYLKNSMIADFRIYNEAIDIALLENVQSTANSMNTVVHKAQLQEAVEALNLDSDENIRTNLHLPSKGLNNTEIKWNSSKPQYINENGEVNRPGNGKKAAKVKLRATLKKGDQTSTKKFKVKVSALPAPQEAVETDAKELTLNANINNLPSDIDLPKKGIEGSEISWKSGNTEFLSHDGEIIKLSPKGAGKQPVELTATITKGEASTTKVITVNIAEDEGYSAYLFPYFTGNGPNEEAIHFALSNDGFNYRALNDGKPVIDSKKISTTGGVRDPHLLRGHNGETFYMVVTDLHVPTCGWNNTAMVLLKSDNLVDWSHSKIDIPSTYTEFADVDRVWAPQTFYDEKEDKYMVYFSMKRPGGIDIIYYAYTNDDFTALEEAPKQLFFSPTNNACIDGDIIYKDGKYHLFFKTEGQGNGLKRAVSDELTSGYELIDRYLQQTDSPVEGSSVFKLINSDTYILMYDMYMSGRYQFTESIDLESFTVIDNAITMDFHPRHGSVLPITTEEAQRLTKKWGKKSNLTFHSAGSADIKSKNIVIDEKKNTIYLPVKYGTDLSAFDPEIKSLPGVNVSPSGKVDFTSGSVKYMFSLDGVGTKTYTVTVRIDNNPVVQGYYADPEIFYSERDGKFYLYPTSDGYDGWSGTYFKTFSSPDLVNWTDEGVILDLLTDVEWANRNAWAPTAIERKIDGTYKYFYYFTAAQKIGVAVNNNPLGRFTDSGKPLVANKPEGVRGGQEIDPDVFHDPVSGNYYLYWGNGYMACVLLNDDMVSIKEESLKLITPDRTFREGAEVFYRNGKYYFLWSENDTRDPSYRVRYGMSSKPDAIEEIPENNLVIEQNKSQDIYATGHNSVIQIPGKDEWYIVYHRFTRPKGIDMGRAAGFHRETSIDKLEFDSNGNILKTTPTLKGISPIVMSKN
ncbi:MAG: family 43 glycosylhydrolase [Prolixibacteraceae bacterium]|jgi:arabinoxylan arabinofuranohydrolase|nr:family 43 glycosylhydrolase [Prolixibacteraceae bacterium]